MKPFALAGSLHMDGVERTSHANMPGKSELQIGEMGYVGPEGVKGGIWADRREAGCRTGRLALDCRLTVPGRVLGVVWLWTDAEFRVGNLLRPANSLKRPVQSGGRRLGEFRRGRSAGRAVGRSLRRKFAGRR